MGIDADRLRALDDLLTSVRLAVQRPGYRRKLLSGLEMPGGISVLRLLRAVEVLSANGAPSIKDVAAQMAVEHSTASRGVDAAVRGGLLRKQPCDDDLRRARLEFTAHGRALLRKASARRRELLDGATEGWQSEDIDRLVELLTALLDGFDTLETTG